MYISEQYINIRYGWTLTRNHAILLFFSFQPVGDVSGSCDIIHFVTDVGHANAQKGICVKQSNTSV